MRYVTISIDFIGRSSDETERLFKALEQYEIVSSTVVREFSKTLDKFINYNHFVIKADDKEYSVKEPYAIEDEYRKDMVNLEEWYERHINRAVNSVGDYKSKVKEAIGHDIKAGEKADFEGENLKFKVHGFKYIDFLDEWLIR